MVALALAALLASPVTVAHVKASFRAQTGVPLVVVGSATTAAITTLSTRSHTSARFGSFEVYVLRPRDAKATLRALLTGGKRVSATFWWTRDQQGGWVATTIYGPNLVAAWFPPGGKRVTDTRFRRLRAVLTKIQNG